MAVAYRSHTAQTTTGSGAIVINKPSGVVDGDLLIGFFSEDSNTPRVTAPAGWTAFSGTGIGADGSIVDGTSAVLQCFYKVASGEGASWSFTPSGTYTGISGVIAYSGADTTTPIDVAAGTSTASSTTHATATITPSVINTMLVGIWMIDSNGANSWSTGDMNERVDQSTGSAAFVTLSVHDLLYGSTSAVSKTATFTATDASAAVIIAIKPASTAITGDASIEYQRTRNNHRLDHGQQYDHVRKLDTDREQPDRHMGGMPLCCYGVGDLGKRDHVREGARRYGVTTEPMHPKLLAGHECEPERGGDRGHTLGLCGCCHCGGPAL